CLVSVIKPHVGYSCCSNCPSPFSKSLRTKELFLLSSFAGFPKCGTEQFVCNNGRCVPLNLRCDGVDECGDSSDEISCLNCTSGSFHCVAAARCVPSRSVCDGRPDCSDGADEQLNTCAPTCARSQFRCTNGRCVPNSGRCDNIKDCEDGSDEENCGI
uniref:Uncharacterized protein n=1 Tax=Sinocyclocheilus anshuiensis TaxID=1608454 RepID=A0A671PWG2_9TELE